MSILITCIINKTTFKLWRHIRKAPEILLFLFLSLIQTRNIITGYGSTWGFFRKFWVLRFVFYWILNIYFPNTAPPSPPGIFLPVRMKWSTTVHFSSLQLRENVEYGMRAISFEGCALILFLKNVDLQSYLIYRLLQIWWIIIQLKGILRSIVTVTFCSKAFKATDVTSLCNHFDFKLNY